ncbi:MAG: Hpt domain-containing protein [Prevotellaceae bacterium]|jgi:HPt (histidine-containing phosphotransfer) domain-containing protein|nr:Hpt domain-containing protein [Prevotellaceae bacterium]
MITDLKYLQQMTGSNLEVMKEMIDLFLSQLADVRSEFDVLLENRNWMELSRVAHKIKSSALVMGIEMMATEMKELELLTKEGKSPEKYPEYIARFNTITDLVEVELKTFLASSV